MHRLLNESTFQEGCRRGGILPALSVCFVVNRFNFQFAIYRLKIKRPPILEGFVQFPPAHFISKIPLDFLYALGDENIFLQRGQVPVMRELPPPVVAFGCIGKHFDDDVRVEQSVPVFIAEFFFSADDSNIRVGVKTGRCDLYAHVTWIDARAGSFAELRAQFRYQVGDDEVMIPGCAGLRKYLTVEIFAFGFGFSFRGQIFFRCDIGNGFFLHGPSFRLPEFVTIQYRRSRAACQKVLNRRTFCIRSVRPREQEALPTKAVGVAAIGF